MLSIAIHSFDKYLLGATMCQVHVLNVGDGVRIKTHSPTIDFTLLNIILHNAIKLKTEVREKTNTVQLCESLLRKRLN